MIDVSSFLISAGYLAMILVLIRVLRLRIFRQSLVSSLRLLLQLFFMGSFLMPFFELNNLYLNIVALLFMIALSAYTAVDRSVVGNELYPKALRVSFLVMMVCSLLVLAPMILLGVIETDAELMIPISAMVIRGVMNRQALAFERFHHEMKAERNTIESYLSLGFNVPAATVDAVRSSVQASLIPTINKNRVAGLVGIPGLMTGLLYAGVPPFTAVQLQATVLWLIFSGSVLAALGVTVMMRPLYFNRRQMLKPEVFTAS